MQQPTQPQPQRASVLFTPGKGFSLTPTSTAANAPFTDLIAQSQTTYPEVLLSGIGNTTITLPASNANEWVLYSISLNINNFPTLKLPSNQKADNIAIVNISPFPPLNINAMGAPTFIAGAQNVTAPPFIVGAQQVTPQALVNGQWVSAQILTSGVEYTAFRYFYRANLYGTSNASAPTWYLTITMLIIAHLLGP